MSFGSRAEKLHGHGHGHGHGHDYDYDYDHGHDLRLHPVGDGFVVPKAKRHRWFHPDPAPWRGIRDSRVDSRSKARYRLMARQSRSARWRLLVVAASTGNFL